MEFVRGPRNSARRAWSLAHPANTSKGTVRQLHHERRGRDPVPIFDRSGMQKVHG